MRYTRTAITQLSKMYKSVLIKCAIFNATVFIGAVGISVNANAATSLVDAIADSSTSDYYLNTTETVTQDLEKLAGNNRQFTIHGNNNDIIASGVVGIIVDYDQTLTIDKVGDIANPDSKGFSGFEKDSGGAIFNKRTVNITDSVFSGNSAYYGGAIYNERTLTVSNSVFSGNTAKNSGGAIHNGGQVANITGTTFSKNSSQSSGGAITTYGTAYITDSVFSGNTAENSGGAIHNGGSLNIIAENKNVLFENNNATQGGAIYNSVELNLNAKNDHKITFSAATDTANNDIFNTGTLNINEGTIEILSAITDDTTSYGTTNIGTENTTATVIANAITQKALNINDGSSLDINADGLKITDTISNSGTITLGDGTLTSAIGGNGSTVVNGDVLWGANAGLTNTTIAQNGSLNIGTNEVTLGNTAIDGTLKMTITDMAKDSNVYKGGKLIVNDLTLGKTSKLSMTVASGLITEENASTGGLDLIVANGETSGKFAEMLSNNRYSVTQDEDGKYKITYTASSSDIVNAGGGNDNNTQTAEAWDKVPTTGNAATDDMQAHLNELSQHDSQGYVKALNNLAPTDSQAVFRTTVDVNNLIDRQIERRQDIQGLNSGDTFQNIGVWMEGLYNYSKQDSSSNNAGFTGKTAGFVLGADGKVNEKTTLGFGYAYNQTDADTLDRDIDVDGHTLFVYGKYQQEKWYVRGMAHYGFADYEEKADVAGKRNSADYDVQNFGVSAYVGYDLPNGFTPEGGLRFTHVSQDSYTDFVGQQISVEDNDILTLVAGAKYSKTFEGENGIHWTPKARAALTYDIMSDDNNANVNIAGINYDINGKRLDRFGVEAGVGLEADINNWNFSIGYDVGIREDYISHTGMLKAKYNF